MKNQVASAGEVVVAAPKKKRKFKLKSFQQFLCTVPALVLIVILNHYPLAQLIRYSFTNWNLLKKTYKYVGWKNWKWLFETYKTNHVLNSFKVTIIYTVLHLVMIIGIGLLFAFLFNRMNRGFSFMRTVLFMPHYIAMSSVAVIFIWLYNESFGVLNYLLNQVGISDIAWLSSGKYALWSVLIMTFWKGVGYDMLIYLSAMQGISKDYYEAARLDGASSFAVARKITLPLLGPTTAYLLVTQFINSMKVFNAVDIMTGGGPMHSTEVVVQLLYKITFDQNRVDRASTVSIVFFFFLLLVTALTMRWSNKKTNYDA